MQDTDLSHAFWITRLVFYYPFTALTVLFTHIMAYPLAPPARHDSALLDVIAGHFGRVEFVSSGVLQMAQAGEFPRLARRIIKRASTQWRCASSLQIRDGTDERTHQNNFTPSTSTDGENPGADGSVRGSPAAQINGCENAGDKIFPFGTTETQAPMQMDSQENDMTDALWFPHQALPDTDEVFTTDLNILLGDELLDMSPTYMMPWDSHRTIIQPPL